MHLGCYNSLVGVGVDRLMSAIELIYLITLFCFQNQEVVVKKKLDICVIV